MKMVKFIDVLAAAIAIACFTPLVIPIGQSTPSLAGIPYTMWVGFLASILLVGLTAVVALIKKKENDGQ
jgi:hypothetical protein